MRADLGTQVRPRWALDRDFYRRYVIFFAPLVFILGLIFLKLLTHFQLRGASLYWRVFTREDGPGEYLTSLIYLVAFFSALAVYRRLRQQSRQLYAVLYFLLGLGFLFIALEEISWGQRIFGISTPEVLEAYNQQGEMNLHNLAGHYTLHAAYILVGAYGAFAHLVVPKLVPARFQPAVTLFVPGAILFFYFFPAFALYLYYDYLSPILVALLGPQWGWETGIGLDRFMIAKDQEAIELILAIGFLLFVERNRRQSRLDRLSQPDSSLGRSHK